MRNGVASSVLGKAAITHQKCGDHRGMPHFILNGKIGYMEGKTVVTTAPPPPSEVKIRTMRSDIESMMQSGGGAPSYRNVSVSGLSLDKEFKAPTNFVTTPMPAAGTIQHPAAENTFSALPGAPDREVDGQEVSDAGPNSDFIPKLIVGLVALVALAVVGYFAYTIFVK